MKKIKNASYQNFSIERNGIIYNASYKIDGDMITVSSEWGTKTTHLSPQDRKHLSIRDLLLSELIYQRELIEKKL